MTAWFEGWRFASSWTCYSVIGIGALPSRRFKLCPRDAEVTRDLGLRPLILVDDPYCFDLDSRENFLRFRLIGPFQPERYFRPNLVSTKPGEVHCAAPSMKRSNPMCIPTCLSSTNSANVLFRVVSTRHLRRRPIIVTMNKPLAALGQVLHDGDLAEAILDCSSAVRTLSCVAAHTALAT